MQTLTREYKKDAKVQKGKKEKENKSRRFGGVGPICMSLPPPVRRDTQSCSDWVPGRGAALQ